MPTDLPPAPALVDAAAWSRRAAVLVVVGGCRLGAAFVVDGAQLTIGRAQGSDVIIPDTGISRVHVALRRDDLGSIQLTDLESTNGTWVGGKRVRRHTLRDGDRVQVGNGTLLEIRYLDDPREVAGWLRYQEEIRDPATGAFVRPYLLDQLGRAFVEARRGIRELAVVALGVDQQDGLADPDDPDDPGGRAWAALGRPVAELLTRRLRDGDVLGLSGPWTFAVLLRGMQPAQALRIAERLLRVVREGTFSRDGGPVPLTLSAGVACYQQGHPEDAAQLLAEAEARLRDARAAGADSVRGDDPRS